MMDLNLFEMLAYQFDKLKSDRGRRNPLSGPLSTRTYAAKIGLDLDFARRISDMMLVPPDQQFLSTIANYILQRNNYILRYIVPLKKKGNLKVKDADWESERTRRIVEVLDGSGLSAYLISAILTHLQDEGKRVIHKALQR